MKSQDRFSASFEESQLPVSTAVAAEFTAGLAAGLDPDASDGRDSSTVGQDAPRRVTTTLRSRWLHRLCPICKHTFRPGDKVLDRDHGNVVHDMADLNCSHTSTDPPTDAIANDAFFDGLTQAWPVPDNVPVTPLESDHWMVAPARAGFSRHSCRVCGHSFRPGDRVVICPCDPNEPRCRVAVHRDILQQLHCWDQWIKGDASEQCLATT